MVTTWLWHLTEQRIDRQGNIDDKQNSIYLDAARGQRVRRLILKLVPFSSSLFIITLCTFLFIYSILSLSLSPVISYFCKETLIQQGNLIHMEPLVGTNTRYYTTKAFHARFLTEEPSEQTGYARPRFHEQSPTPTDSSFSELSVTTSSRRRRSSPSFAPIIKVNRVNRSSEVANDDFYYDWVLSKQAFI